MAIFDKEVYTETLSNCLLVEYCPRCNCEDVQLVIFALGKARVVCANCGCILKQVLDSVDYNLMDWDVNFMKGEQC